MITIRPLSQTSEVYAVVCAHTCRVYPCALLGLRGGDAPGQSRSLSLAETAAMQESEEPRPSLFSSSHVTAEQKKRPNLGSDSCCECKNRSNHNSFNPGLSSQESHRSQD